MNDLQREPRHLKANLTEFITMYGIAIGYRYQLSNILQLAKLSMWHHTA